jgi:hypothetical protein
MAKEFNPNPWEKTNAYIDRTYASGVAGARPMLTTRIHCEPDDKDVNYEEAGVPGSDKSDRVRLFNSELRSGLGTGRPSNDD